MIAAGLADPLATSAQSPDAVRFDVASVKPAGPYGPPGSSRRRGGPGTSEPALIDYPQVFLMDLLSRAFGLPSDQISGPDWLVTERYSLAARMRPDTTKEGFNLMLRNLIVERFHLAFHYAKKDFPAYELVVAAGGPKMKRAPAHEDATPAAPPRPAGRASDSPKDGRGFPVLRPGVGESWATSWDNGMARSSYRITMPKFAGTLGSMVNASVGGGTETVPRVVDSTGLGGTFAFTLEFAGQFQVPESVRALIAAAQGNQPPQADAAGLGGGPTLFKALEDQLGLKLVKGKKVALDVLVIDHVDRVPTAN